MEKQFLPYLFPFKTSQFPSVLISQQQGKYKIVSCINKKHVVVSHGGRLFYSMPNKKDTKIRWKAKSQTIKVQMSPILPRVFSSFSFSIFANVVLYKYKLTPKIDFSIT